MRLMRTLVPLLIAAPFAAGFAACGPPPAPFTVNSTADTADAKIGDGVCATAGNVCTLRAAIQEANATPVKDTINFAIGTGLHTITPATPLPALQHPVALDASTQPGSGTAPRIELNGNNIGTAPVLDDAAGASVIRGFLIDHASSTGLLLEGTAGGTTVAGNVLSPAPGSSDSSGPTGLKVTSPGNTIGGTTAADRNSLTHGKNGIWVYGGSGNLIEGNYVGLNLDGTAPLGGGNPIAGIVVQAPNTTVGGTSAGARNVISNNFQAMQLLGRNGASCATAPTVDGTVVQGNYIGLSPTGAAASVGNYAGIDILNGANVKFGGTATGAGNVISGNLNGAMDIRVVSTGCGDTSHNISISGNTIGLTPGGAAAPNGGDGIDVLGASTNIAIGGPTAGSSNRIRANTGAGVALINDTSGSPVNVTVVGNSIDANGRLGIDLGLDGVTPNHVGGAVVGTPNGLLNYPVLTNEFVFPSGTTVTGTVNGAPSTAYTVDVYDSATCDPSGHGEGGTYLGRVVANTDSAGNASWVYSTSTVIPVPSQLTATTTDDGGSTSEFASCFAVNGAG